MKNFKTSAGTAAQKRSKRLLLARFALLLAIPMLCAVFLSSCNGDKSENGLIVVDPNTGKQYLLKHNVGDTYFVYEREMKIVGKDTTWTFSK